MPVYLFHCNSCSKDFEAVFSMNEEKKASCPECKSKNCNRTFTVPRASVDTKINAFDIKAMTEKSGKMRGNIGNLWDMAAEASEKRGGDNDPIRKKALESYAKRRKGKQYRKPVKDFSIEFKVKK